MHWKSAEEIRTLAVYEDHLARFPSRPIHSDCRVEVLEFDTGIGG
jgi:hypothetical protein